MDNVVVETVTPERAKEMLEQNYEDNRPVSAPVVKRYVYDMVSGNWHDDASGIISISDSGKVLDGQHRLRAVVESGTTHRFAFRYGLDESEYRFFDQGKNRTVADVLGSNVPSRANAAAVAAAWCAYENTSRNIQALVSRNNYGIGSKDDILEVFDKHKDEINEMVNIFQRIRRQFVKMKTRPFVIAYLLMADIDIEVRNRVLAGMAAKGLEGNYLQANSTWNRYAANGTLTSEWEIYILLKLFDAERENYSITAGSFNKKESFIARYNKEMKEQKAARMAVKKEGQ